MEKVASELIAMNVQDFMTTDVITLNEDDDLDLAHMEMSLARIRHLPVVRKGRLMGLVTHRDILGAMCSVFAEIDRTEQSELLRMVSVSQIMSRDVRTVDPGCEAIEAARVLLESKFGCLPVVSESYQLVGIVTEADFVELAVQLLEIYKDDDSERADESGKDQSQFIRKSDDKDW